MNYMYALNRSRNAPMLHGRDSLWMKLTRNGRCTGTEMIPNIQDMLMIFPSRICPHSDTYDHNRRMKMPKLEALDDTSRKTRVGRLDDILFAHANG
jgi:hypothetical protein